ncbi:MAG: DUF4383 domain-containing protein [Pseudonocardiaceae bacterium]
MPAGKSPAQLYALVFGVVLVAAGILGFFVNSSFDVGGDVPRDTLILFDVNAWHNIVHLLSGAVGLAVAGSYSASRLYALGYGAVYVLVTILGFAVGDGGTIIGLIPINTEDNILHILIAAAGIGAGLATPAQPAPTTTATA